MKTLALFFFAILSIPNTSTAQLTEEDCKTWIKQKTWAIYSYSKKYVGEDGVGSPAILTSDGGMIATACRGGEGYQYRDIAVVVKFNFEKDTVWRVDVKPIGEGSEAKYVIQDKKGNTFLFTNNYFIHSEGESPQQRIVMIDKKGKIKWDKVIGIRGKFKNPHFTKVTLADNGLDIQITGWIYKDEEASKAKNRSDYTATINSKGKIKESYE